MGQLEWEKRLAYCIRHYEFVVSTWVKYYRLYMQSWTIFGSAILAGALASLMKSGEGLSLSNALLAFIPIVIIIWFLLTSHFWGLLAMYSKYASDLEGEISKAFPDSVGFSIYSHTGRYWYISDKPSTSNRIRNLIITFCVIGYLIISWQASKVFRWPVIAFLFYIGIMITALWAIIEFIPPTEEPEIDSSRMPANEVLTKKDL